MTELARLFTEGFLLAVFACGLWCLVKGLDL